MNDVLFSPELQVIAGGLGTIFALWSIQRRQQGLPMHPDAAKSDTWLLIFSALMAAIGLFRFVTAIS